MVTITINGVEDAPMAGDDAVSGNENTEITGNLLANDTDKEANALTASLVSGPANGSLALNADGSFSYTPDADWNGTDSFTYTANDGALDSNVATVTITVNPVDDADPDDGGSTTTDPELFEDPNTDDEQDSDTEIPTYEDPANDPVIEDEQAPPVVESLTPRDSVDADEQLVNVEEPESEEAEEIIYLTDEIDMDIQPEEREDDHSFIYFDNDLYKDLSLSKYLAINYTAADEPILKIGNDFSILDLNSDDPNRVNVNSDYDLHRQQIDESFSYLLRVGSMVSSLMSSLPLWRGFDPIAIFPGDKKRKKDRNKMQNTNKPKSETFFDGEAE